jgi:hypothetical protein
MYTTVSSLIMDQKSEDIVSTQGAGASRALRNHMATTQDHGSEPEESNEASTGATD